MKVANRMRSGFRPRELEGQGEQLGEHFVGLGGALPGILNKVLKREL